MVEFKVSDHLIVVFDLGERLRSVFESIGVQRRADVVIVVDYLQLRLEGCPDFSVVVLSPGLQQFRDIDVLGPFLFVLLALEALDFDQISHFNFQL